MITFPSISAGILSAFKSVFSPKDIDGLKLWINADYGISKGVQFLSSIEIIGCDPSSSDGLYERAVGGNTTFQDSSTGNFIEYIEGIWILNDVVAGLVTFITETINDENSWYTQDGISFGSATNSTSNDPSAVSEVEDISQNENLIQSNGALYINTNVINGKPAFDCDGGRLERSDIVTGKTLYAVIKTKSALPGQYACILELTGGGLYSAIIGTARWGSYFSTEIGVDTGLSANTSYIIGSLSDTAGSGTSYKLRQNGSQVKSGTSNSYYPRNALYFGNDGTMGQPANCYIAELIIYNRAITDTEAAALENYLNNKYNIY